MKKNFVILILAVFITILMGCASVPYGTLSCEDKELVTGLILGEIPSNISYSGDSGYSQETVVYTFFVNVVSEKFRFPLIGFINIAKGNHTVPQIGFVNWNTGNFSSLQMSFVNTAGSNLNGLQAGFVNTVVNDTKGLQVGFVNTSVGDVKGAQFGFVNTVANGTNGLQLGFVNTSVGDVKGVQFGFVNTAAKGGEGLQFGFVNTSMKKLKGVQFGFVNYADSIEDGVPIGFLSIIRNGGYHTVEYSFSEFYHINIGLKLGDEKFYTAIFAAYNPYNLIDGFVLENFAAGWGFGSILPITASIFFNPEIICLTNSWVKDNRSLLSFVPYLGYNITKNFSVLAAPSLTWVHNNDVDELEKPFFKIVNYEINENDSLVVGARASVRVRF